LNAVLAINEVKLFVYVCSLKRSFALLVTRMSLFKFEH